jgi:hypothetical protein
MYGFGGRALGLRVRSLLALLDWRESTPPSRGIADEVIDCVVAMVERRAITTVDRVMGVPSAEREAN